MTQTLEQEALDYYIENSDGITIGIPFELAASMRTALAQTAVTKPLTEDQILAAIKACGADLHGRISMTFERVAGVMTAPTFVALKFVRAVEAAHEIKEAK